MKPTGSSPETNDRSRATKLDEFETGSSNLLAPFEESCSILLDEPPADNQGMLAELDLGVETIYVNELDDTDDDAPEPGVSPEQDRPGQPEVPVGEDERDFSSAEQEFEETPPAADEGEKLAPEAQAVPPPKEPLREPLWPVIGFVCEHAFDVSVVTDASGRLAERPIVRLFALPCAGMVKPSWLRFALENGASGVFVVTCPPTGCYHRTGGKILCERWSGTRRPMVLRKLDRKRLRLIGHERLTRDEIIEEIKEFLAGLARLDEIAFPPREEEPEVTPHIDPDDFLM